jgi:hypothetical protein
LSGRPILRASKSSKNNLNQQEQTIIMPDLHGKVRARFGKDGIYKHITADFMEDFALVKQDII